MALQHLLSMISPDLAEAQREVLSQWTETPSVGGPADDLLYGVFVDEHGLVSPGFAPTRASLESDDPRALKITPELERSLPPGAAIAFIDWGRQSLDWEEIFDLWSAWNEQSAILGCGCVAVQWVHCDRWVSPGWIAFAEGFDGAPLSLVNRAPAPPVSASKPILSPLPEIRSSSFLARAKKIRGEESEPRLYGEGERLPMLPFTLDSFQDPNYRWPEGVA